MIVAHEGPKILIIDDEKNTRRNVRGILEDYDYRACEATDGFLKKAGDSLRLSVVDDGVGFSLREQTEAGSSA